MTLSRQQVLSDRPCLGSLRAATPWRTSDQSQRSTGLFKVYQISDMAKRILFVLTSADKTVVGTTTVRFPHPRSHAFNNPDNICLCFQGWFLPEAAHPYYGKLHLVLSSATANSARNQSSLRSMTSTSPLRRAQTRPWTPLASSSSETFLEDPVVKDKLANAKKLDDVKAADYDAVFYVGGQGPVIDLPTDLVNIKLATEVGSHHTVLLQL